jgi:tetratricopeptide (TPR) repeat protein
MQPRLAPRLALLCSLGWVTLGWAGVAWAQAAPDPRAEAYGRFTELFRAGQYAEALPHARQVLALTEAMGPDHPDLPKAINNLATVQLRTGDLAGAEANYRRALELAEESSGVASPALVAPLAGLGAVYAAQAQHGRAAEAYTRALAVSRRNDGLFNLKQLNLIEALIPSLLASGDLAGVDRERFYALRVVQQQYGARDPRTLPMLLRLGEWYEQSQQYERERAAYNTAYQVAAKESGGRNEAAVLALLGVGRSYRLQFVFDPESMLNDSDVVVTADGRVETRSQSESQQPFPTAVVAQPRLDRQGESALLQALATLEAVPNAPAALKARVLVELGDWYMTARKKAEAIARYRQAWPLLPASLVRDQVNPLLAPRQLLYRPPPAALVNRERPRSEVIERSVEHRFTVTAEGEVTDVELLASDVGSSSREGRTRRSLQDAIYSPRFDQGEPVTTTDVHARQTYYDLKSAEKPAPAEPQPK